MLFTCTLCGCPILCGTDWSSHIFKNSRPLASRVLHSKRCLHTIGMTGGNMSIKITTSYLNYFQVYTVHTIHT